ncbi:hypothetical protein C8R47DRAFT_258479 [Mycena vitilis]|nr:hypothetical protein C8R47DRAFT_258479 [Mycena vitilis]
MHPTLEFVKKKESRGVPSALQLLVLRAPRTNDAWKSSLAHPGVQYKPMLPVFYHSLNPVGIPSSGAVDVMCTTGEAIPTVAPAAFALYVIATMRGLPSDVYPEIWSRAWPWIEFLHTYHTHLAVAGLIDKVSLYASFVELCVVLQANGFPLLVATTSGVGVVVATAWAMALDGSIKRDDDEARSFELRNISYFFNWDVRDRNLRVAVEEYSEGVGGSVDSLASTIVKHLTHASSSNPMSDRAVSYLTAAVALIMTVNKAPREISNLFIARLRRRGLIRALVSCVCSLNPVAADHSNGPALIVACFSLLSVHLSLSHGRTATRDALQGGLLRAVVLVASTHTALCDVMIGFLDILPGHMVYRSILQHMPACLNEVTDLMSCATFVRCALFSRWQTFEAHVRERLAFLETFDQRMPDTYRACDNSTCNALCERSKLRRCSVCLDLYYCSSNCQAMDWRAGHREFCKQFSTLRRDPQKPRCSRYDQHFLHALVRKDWATYMVAEGASRLRQDPPGLCVVRFDYTAGAVSIDVVPHRSLHPDGSSPSSAWLARRDDIVRRVMGSNGLLEMYMIRIPAGLNQHWDVRPSHRARHDTYETVDEGIDVTSW